MTTPQTFSPNIRILPKGLPVPEGAPPSETPLAELLLGDFPDVRDHYAERDVLAALENVPVIITIAARAGWTALAQDISDATETGRALLADWWRHGWTQTFQRPAFWAAPVTPPDPEAHPYPVPAPVAGSGGEFAEERAPAVAKAAHEVSPAPVAEPERDPEEDAPAGRAVADDEPAPATDPVAVLRAHAGKQDAAEEPDATRVIEPAKAETEAVPAVTDEDGGDGDE